MYLEPHFTDNYMFITVSLLYSCDNEIKNKSLYTVWEDNQFNTLDKRLSKNIVLLI